MTEPTDQPTPDQPAVLEDDDDSPEVDTEHLAADAAEAAVDETAPDPDHDPYRPAEPVWSEDGSTYVLDWTHPQLAADFDVLDLFAAGGGWDHGARSVENIDHDAILGIEWDLAACRTAIAAGHRRLMGDIALLDPRDFARRAHELGRAIVGLIGSPPCQGFSMAGDGGGRRDTPFILEAVDRILASDLSYEAVEEVLVWLRSACEDEKSALVLEPLRWALVLGPEWVAWEQVPAVLPLWKSIARVLKKAGYKVWVGKLVAADYGVPQTRTRAILIASRVRHVSMPEPTHAKGGADATLFSPELPPWVSMATALGWGMTARPYFSVAAGTKSGGQDPSMIGGSGARKALFEAAESDDWIEDPHADEKPQRVRVQRGNYGHGGEATAAERGRSVRLGDEPSLALTGRPPQWLDIGADSDPDDPTVKRALEQIELRGGVMPNAARRTLDEPAQTIAFGHNAAQWTWEVREDGTQVPPEGTDPADVEFVIGADEDAARRPADQPAPTVMFGARLNTVTWRQRDDGTQVPPDGVAPIMLSGGIAGDGVPRGSDQPAPTLGGKGTAVWVESEDQWIRGERLATGETPKGAAMLQAGRRFPTRPLEPGEAVTELRRGGDRITEGFDPATEPAATVTSRVDRWQTKLVGAGESFCVFCRCSDDLHDADGFCAGPCGAGERDYGHQILCTWADHSASGAYATGIPSDRLPPGHRGWSEPAPTIVGTRRSSEGMIVGRQLPPGQSVAVGGWDDRTPGDQIGPNRPDAADPDGATVDLWGDRPATTIVASRNADIVSGPGYRGPGAAPRQNAPGGVRVTVAEAAVLQSFPADYPWQGTKSKQYEAVGNAVPPRLGAHVLAEATGSPVPTVFVGEGGTPWR